MSAVEFRVLGPFEVVADGVALAVGGPKPRAVLATLALRPNEVVSTDALVAALWDGDTAPASAVGMVRTYVSRLRQLLSEHAGARLVGRPPGYVLETDADRVDAHRFEQLVGEGRAALASGRSGAAATTLARALRLWRGEALADLAHFGAFRPIVVRLTEMRLAATESRIEAELALGRHAELVGELEALTEANPFREHLWVQRIVALYRSGRQADGLAAYQDVRAALRDHLGLDPGPELRALERQILDQAVELHWRPPAAAADVAEPAHPSGAPPSGTPQRGAVPVPATRFFGRDAEIAELIDLASQARVVTLVGAPGGGKTRLAIELATRLDGRLSGGAWFVDLAPVGEPGQVPYAVAAALGISEQPGRAVEDTVVEALRSAEPRLLVLDNCEHVVEAIAGQAQRLVASCPGLRLLATSRVRLGVAGEELWQVGPLERAPAVRLFVDRARLATHGLRVDQTGAAMVAGICDRLDGLPLAIELTAAWTRLLSLGQIRDRLDRALQLLRQGNQNGDPRHRTMAATVQWSYGLLPPAARTLFEQVSVFAGSFDLAAVEAVATEAVAAADVLDALASLVDHSLVLTEPAAEGPMRYRMLEPVRQYGEAVLAANDPGERAWRRHAEHFLAVAGRCEPFGIRGEPAAPVASLVPDERNLIAALDWARAQPPDLALRLCVALAPLWEFRGPLHDGRTWLEETLAAGADDPDLGIAALWCLGKLAWRQGDNDGARAVLDEGLAAAARIDDQWWDAHLRVRLALAELSAGDPGGAAAHCVRALETFRAQTDDAGVMWAAMVLGWVRYTEGDVAAGDEQMQAAVAANRRIGNVTAAAQGSFGLAYGALLAGDTARQRRHMLDALDGLRAGGCLEETDWLACSSALLAREGDPAGALRLMGGALSLSRRGGSQFPPEIARPIEELLELVAREAGGDAGRLLAEGSQLTFDELAADVVPQRSGAGPGPDR